MENKKRLYEEEKKLQDMEMFFSEEYDENKNLFASLDDINSLNIIINDNNCSNTFFKAVCSELEEDGIIFKEVKGDTNLEENSIIITLDQQYMSGPSSIIIAPYQNNSNNDSDALALALNVELEKNGMIMGKIACGVSGYRKTEYGVSERVPTSTEEKITDDSSYVTIAFGVQSLDPKIVATSIKNSLIRYYSYVNNVDGKNYLSENGKLVPYDLIYRIEHSENLEDVKNKLNDSNVQVSDGLLENQVIINSCVKKINEFSKDTLISLSEKTKGSY